MSSNIKKKKHKILEKIKKTNIFKTYLFNNINDFNINDFNINDLNNLINFLSSLNEINYNKIYLENYNKYNIDNKEKLNKLLKYIDNYIYNLKKHLIKININVLYIDIINKNIKNYIIDNIKDIINKLFINIELFYILSIIYNNNNSNIYILNYNTNFFKLIKSYF